MALDVRLFIALAISCDISYFQRRYYYKLDGKQQMEETGSLRNKSTSRVVINLDRWLSIGSIKVTTHDEHEIPNVYVRHFDGLNEMKHECSETRPFAYDCSTVGRFGVVESKSVLLEVSISTLYIRSDSYIGCFKNKSTIEIEGLRTGLAECDSLCGTLFGLNKNCDCVCVQSLNELIQVDLSLCTKYCDNDEVCGGDNYLAIYWKDAKSIGYSNSSWDCIYELNECPKCPKGRKGTDCEIIDCAVDNGNCGDSECQSITLWKFFPFKNCFCASGYHVGPTQCEDIDECANSSDLCDASSTKCVNSQGSYTCEALREHEKEEEKELEKEHEKEQDKEQKNGTDQEKDPKAEMILVYTGAGFAALALLCIVILYIYFKKKGPTKE